MQNAAQIEKESSRAKPEEENREEKRIVNKHNTHDVTNLPRTKSILNENGKTINSKVKFDELKVTDISKINMNSEGENIAGTASENENISNYRHKAENSKKELNKERMLAHVRSDKSVQKYKQSEVNQSKVLIIKKDGKMGETKATKAIKEKNCTYTPKLKIHGEHGKAKYVEVKCGAAKNNTLKLMLDSGADINLIKINSLKHDVNFFPNKRMNLCGISGSIASLGTVFLMLKIGRKNSCHECQLVDANLPDQIDGILGKPVTDMSKIDFQNNELIYDDSRNPAEERLKDIIFNENRIEINHNFSENQNSNKSNVLESQNDSNLHTDKEVNQVLKFIKSIESCEAKSYMITTEEKNLARKEKIMNSFDTKHLSSEQLAEVTEIIMKHSKVFRFNDEPLPANTVLQHRIQLDTEKPIWVPQYQLSRENEDFAEKELERWEKIGVCERTSSPFNSPVLVVDKPELVPNVKRKRLCLDLRVLNSHILPSKVLMQNIPDLIKRIGKHKHFIQLDLSESYLQSGLHPSSTHYVCVSIKQKRWSLNRCPFGMKDSFNSLQFALEKALEGLEGIFNYADDLLVVADDIATLLKRFKDLLERLEKYQFSVNPEKLIILKEQAKFLGMNYSENGLEMSSKKAQAIISCPRPKNPKEIMSFIAMTNFFRIFIRDHSKICESLLKLIRKNAKWEWTDECEASFNKLKESLSSPPILCHASDMYKDNVITCLMTDSSDTAIGGAWLLYYPESNSMRPVEFFSSTLNKTMRNYSIFDKEMYSLVYALKKYKYYLSDRKVIAFTDNKGLSFLPTMKLDHLEPRVIRWALKIQNFKGLRIIHIPGSENKIADCLSRLYQEDDENNNCIPISDCNVYVMTRSKSKPSDQIATPNYAEENTDSNEDLPSPDTQEKKTTHNSPIERRKPGRPRKADRQPPATQINDLDNDSQVADEIINNSSQFLNETVDSNAENSDVEDLPESQAKTIEDRKEQMEIIKSYHENPLSGHQGIKRTLDRIKVNFFWRGMTADVRKYVRTCPICQKYKSFGTRSTPAIPLGIISISRKPWEKVFIDMMQFPEYNGYKYLLIVQDSLTRFCVSRPLKTREADVLSRVLVEIFTLFDTPAIILNDNAAEMQSKVLKRIATMFHIKHEFITAYNSQANYVERTNQIFSSEINCFLDGKKDKDWPQLSYLICYNFNTAVNFTGVSPYLAIFGRQPRQFISKHNVTVPVTLKDYCDKLKHSMSIYHKILRSKTICAREKTREKVNANRKNREYAIGQLVLKQNKAKKDRLDVSYSGPYEVTQDVNTHCVKVLIKGKEKIINKRFIVPFHQRQTVLNTSESDEE
jgi:transposase InsO family protein